MKLYELKFEIQKNDKQKIIRGLGLEYSRQYVDTDYFLAPTKKGQKRKYKEVEGRTILYDLEYNKQTGLFEIKDQELTEDYSSIDQIKKEKVNQVIKRTKEVYLWPGKPVRVAFDSIEGLGDRQFCEIYDKDEASVFEAKQRVVDLGFTRFIEKTYDEFFKKSSSIINLTIIIAIIITIAVIAYVILK